MWETLQNNADWDCFKTPAFAEDLEDSKSTSGRTLCTFGSHTFVPISWMYKKQTSVSHSSTESEIISLDAALRMDGISALDLWDLIVTVLHGNTNQSKQVQGDLSTSQTRKKIPGKIDDLNSVDFVSSNANSSRKEAMLYMFEDNEAVIKRIIKGRSPTMRHVSRTRRVALGWLFDRINLDFEIQIKYIETKNQLADILTKGNFTRNEWNHLLCLFNISRFSCINSVKAMSKRTQEDAGEEKVTAKSKPMTNLVSICRVRDPTVLASTASENPVNTKSESQNVPLSSLHVQQTGTVRPVMLASSSNSSEWNNDDKWSSQVRKSGEMSEQVRGDLYLTSWSSILIWTQTRRIGPFSNKDTGGMECSVVLFKPRIHLFACTHPSVSNSLVVSKPFELWILVAYTHQSPAWSFKHVWMGIPCLSTSISLQPCHQSPVLCSNTFGFWFLSVYTHLSTALCFKHGCLLLLVAYPPAHTKVKV